MQESNSEKNLLKYADKTKELSSAYLKAELDKLEHERELRRQDLEFHKMEHQMKLEIAPKLKEQDMKYWDDINKAYFELIERAHTAFKTNLTINKVLVVIGVLLLFNGVLYSWINGTDIFSLMTGATGVAFITLFFAWPQKQINRAIGTLVQIQMIFKTHAATWEFVKYYGLEKIYKLRESKNGFDVKEAKEVFLLYQEAAKTTETYLKMVQQLVEKGSPEPPQITGTAGNKDIASKTPI